MTKIAVIETGGKQYLVTEWQKIQVEKKPIFDRVLLWADLPAQASGEPKVEIGKPYLAGRKIAAEVLGEKRLPKVTTFKYHSKTRFRKKKGHRQTVALVRITGI